MDEGTTGIGDSREGSALLVFEVEVVVAPDVADPPKLYGLAIFCGFVVVVASC